MEKAIAYLFGNKIVGTVKLTNVDDYVFYEIDIKNLYSSDFVLELEGDIHIIDFSYLPILCNERIRLCFYSDVFLFYDLLDKKIFIKNRMNDIVADGNIIKVYPGKRFYSEDK
ncbi:MAG: hypothetical protein IJZ94_03865 [Clostridia bacterium]|nr:hypothetical protein [Clostridia bacterium]